jgi:serine O-acetyltransferase
MKLLETLRMDMRSFNLVHPENGVLKYFYYPDARTVIIFRLGQWFYQYRLLRPLSYVCTILNDLIAGVWIGPRVKAGGGLVFAHARGLVVNPSAVIGKNCLILQRVTIGGPNVVIGDNVALYANATVVSNVRGRAKLTIGSHVIIGAGTVLTSDVPDCSIAAGVPGKVIKSITPAEDWVAFAQGCLSDGKNPSAVEI